MSSAEERATYDQFMEKWQAYLEQHAELLKLSKANRNNEAIELLRGKSQDLFDALSSDLMDLVQLNTQGSEQSQEQGQEIYTSSLKSLIAANLVVVIIALSIAILIARSVGRPMSDITAFAQSVAGGDLDARIETRYGAEFGQAQTAIEIMVNNLKASQAEERKKLEEMNTIMSQVAVVAREVGSGSAMLNDSSQSLSQGATEQAASLEQISSSMVELGSQTSTNAQNAIEASSLAGEARTAAEQGSQEMAALVGAMNEINTASQNIAKIIKVIDEIAFQTNLLALNAAVEAARAGQHGKGFAVVAEEVRNLAGRSAKAAKETADLIDGSVQKTTKGGELVNSTAKSLEAIKSAVSKTADLVVEIAAASNEQAQGFAQVSQGLSQVDLVTQQNTANAEETASTAEELASQAENLNRIMAQFGGGGQNGTGAARSARQNLKATSVRSPKALDSAAPEAPALYGLTTPEDVIPLDDTEFGKY
ncbi:MAG: methyl-accepting chemotaxis protein [Desulfovibrio sp.]